MDFKLLHQQESPLLIGNVWDAASARTFERLKFQALGTASAAIAATLGYEDGECISFTEVEYVVKRILAATSLPLSVDLEAGYSRDITTTIEYIERLHQLGVVGINVEDSRVDEKRKLVDSNVFAQTIALINQHLKGKEIDLFLNVRTDTFLLETPNAVDETIRRIKRYEQAGANGIFVPGAEREDDIIRVVSATALPVNVIATPNLPSFDRLKSLGIKRISTGNWFHWAMHQRLMDIIAVTTKHQSFHSLF